MNIQNSCIVGQQFIVPYSSSLTGNNQDHRYCYWSLKDAITLSSLTQFYANDIMTIKDINIEDRIISLEPFNGELVGYTPSILILASNDIPLDENEDYSFVYQGCDCILQFATAEGGNKIYSFALKVNSAVATVKGYCNLNKNRINLQVFCDLENGTRN
jgi:hypothetical protein